ncbi:hypothetical protein HPB52_000943 [Rhipicephalus sanguineus]|uniref:Uncharacterized protein n=1 Tax=Rhipicephalus sanguineus TaxID=34632 RepID=A0A9D4PL00_RHISA|nr:hypothetical protein HPB52_000943 [Rhipicephalus sanguineus]
MLHAITASSQKEEVESPFWSTSSLLTGPLVEAYEQLDTWCLGSDHFERSVAQTLLVVFAINVVLILCVWRRCGDQIADQFLNLERFFDNSRDSSLLSEARGGVLRTRTLQAKYTPSTSTTCHRCSAAEETIKLVVLECTGLQPGPPLEQTNPSCPNALATALGFHEQGAPPNWKEVELTKRRLEHWWRTRNPPAPPESADK